MPSACGHVEVGGEGGGAKAAITRRVEVATKPDSISRSRLRRVTAARACVGCSSAGLRSCVRCVMDPRSNLPSLPSHLDRFRDAACPAGGGFTSSLSPRFTSAGGGGVLVRRAPSASYGSGPSAPACHPKIRRNLGKHAPGFFAVGMSAKNRPARTRAHLRDARNIFLRSFPYSALSRSISMLRKWSEGLGGSTSRPKPCGRSEGCGRMCYRSSVGTS